MLWVENEEISKVGQKQVIILMIYFEHLRMICQSLSKVMVSAESPVPDHTEVW